MARQNTFLDPRGKLLVAGEQEEKKTPLENEKRKETQKIRNRKIC